jgi:hypothetical protein
VVEERAGYIVVEKIGRAGERGCRPRSSGTGQLARGAHLRALPQERLLTSPHLRSACLRRRGRPLRGRTFPRRFASARTPTIVTPRTSIALPSARVPRQSIRPIPRRHRLRSEAARRESQVHAQHRGSTLTHGVAASEVAVGVQRLNARILEMKSSRGRLQRGRSSPPRNVSGPGPPPSISQAATCARRRRPYVGRPPLLPSFSSPSAAGR